MDREILEAAELTRNILIDWIPVFEDTGFDYDIQIPDRPAQVSLDAECYRRILNNLIQNVLSHSHGSWVEIRMLQKAREVSISVSDNGVGMESEDLKHILSGFINATEPVRKKEADWDCLLLGSLQKNGRQNYCPKSAGKRDKIYAYISFV